MDTWFVGFTPRWVCGVWVGFDEKKKIGEKETGGAISAPIFLNTMKSFLEESERDDREGLQRALEEEAKLFDIGVVPVKSAEPLDFEPPAGVEPRWISRDSGQRMKEGTPGAVKEYFVMGNTRPMEESGSEQSAAPIDEYFESGQL
jgi:penicillin-binding protein 1A